MEHVPVIPVPVVGVLFYVIIKWKKNYPVVRLIQQIIVWN